MSLKVIKACLLDYCVAKLHAVNEKKSCYVEEKCCKTVEYNSVTLFDEAIDR